MIPAYNESLRLAAPLRQIAAYLEIQSYTAEIVVVDDGSSDGTFELARSVASDVRTSVAVYRYARNQGKGYALKVGFECAGGDILLLCDADLATPIEELARLLPAFDKGADVVIGSRKMPGALIRTHQPQYREMLGKVFTWLVRKTIADVSDVTCGFKAFRRRAGQDLFRRTRLYDWSFDAEILMLAAKDRLVLLEVPVSWEDKPGTKVQLSRDIFRSLAGLFRLRRNMSTGVYREENRVSPQLETSFNEAWSSRAGSDSRADLQAGGRRARS